MLLALLLAGIALFTPFTSADAHCSQQNACMRIEKQECSRNGDREVCIYWDSSKSGCGISSPFDSVCATGDRALRWYSGSVHKRCVTVKNGSDNTATFGIRGKNACSGTASFSDHTTGSQYDASCQPVIGSPCRRVRVGLTSGFCEWKVIAPKCFTNESTTQQAIPTPKPTINNNKPLEKPTRNPTKMPTDATSTDPPSACSTPHGCTAEMLSNDYCDLRCHISECNHDNNQCGGYVHIEYVGDKDADPRIMPAIMEATRRINKVIKPEAQMPYRIANPFQCWWETDIPSGLLVNQLIIVAGPRHIDGLGGTLAQAGPCSQRTRPDGTRFAIDGQVRLDENDFSNMLESGYIIGLLMHEVGHALGIGTLWENWNLVKNPRYIGGIEQKENHPTYNGVEGNKAWREIVGSASGDAPIEDSGGQGSADGHWEEDIFKDELMTGWLTMEPMPMSKVTLGSFADMGIPVYFDRADEFTPDLSRRLRGSKSRALGDEEKYWIPIGSDVIMPIAYKEVQLADGTVGYDGVY